MLKTFRFTMWLSLAAVSGPSLADIVPAHQWNTFELKYPQDKESVLLANVYALPVNKVHRSVRSDTCNLLIPKQANISLTVKVEDTGKPLRITALGNPQLRFVVVDPEQKFSCGAKASKLYGIPTFDIDTLKPGTYQIFVGHQLKTSSYAQVFVQKP